MASISPHPGDSEAGVRSHHGDFAASSDDAVVSHSQAVTVTSLGSILPADPVDPVDHAPPSAVAPFHRIPPEIIAKIISYSALLAEGVSYEIKEEDNAAAARESNWVAVTHVCYQWRAIALSDARLWARVNFDLGGAWARIFIERAKDLPLSFHARRDFTHMSTRVALDHLHRATALHLSSPDDGFEDFFLETVQGNQLRNVETVNLSTQYKNTSEEWRRPNSFVLFQSMASRNLRHLSLCIENTMLYSSMHSMRHLSGLQTLKIIYKDSDARLMKRMGPGADELVRTIGRMKALEVLVLNVVPLPPDEPNTSPTAYLPQLTELSLGSTYKSVDFMMAHLDVPDSARIALQCNATSPSDFPSDRNRLCTSLGRHFPFAPAAAAIRCPSPSPFHRRLVFSAWRTQGHPIKDSQPDITVSFDWRFNDRDTARTCQELDRDLAATLLERVGSLSLQQLTVDAPLLPWPVECWEHIIVYATEIERLSTDAASTRALCPPLLEGVLCGSEVLPVLSSWTLRDLEVSLPEIPRGEDEIVAAVRALAEGGTQLREVVLEASVAPDEWMDELRSAAGAASVVVADTDLAGT
ncbi:hypothetical protein FA95DRAFT_1569575 [Auriscalpium vulgare]|uniref:Uncharacterized protein n=1 Tax=Auriscalpium vulgare TaxID=40419 RepID=A0ACB8S7W8_9AGAM|nr:hypothetical protein FA95DRAFT_1569575 [Auriscalpium vulgare]